MIEVCVYVHVCENQVFLSVNVLGMYDAPKSMNTSQYRDRQKFFRRFLFLGMVCCRPFLRCVDGRDTRSTMYICTVISSPIGDVICIYGIATPTTARLGINSVQCREANPNRHEYDTSTRVDENSMTYSLARCSFANSCPVGCGAHPIRLNETRAFHCTRCEVKETC